MEGKKPRRHSKEGKISFDKETVFGRKPTCASREKIKMIEESCEREREIFSSSRKKVNGARLRSAVMIVLSHTWTHTHKTISKFLFLIRASNYQIPRDTHIPSPPTVFPPQAMSLSSFFLESRVYITMKHTHFQTNTDGNGYFFSG